MISERKIMLTPLGAAWLEADSRSRRMCIDKEFKHLKRCPVSKKFDVDAILRFYRSAIIPIPDGGFPWESNA